MGFWDKLFTSGPPNIDELLAKKKVNGLVSLLSYQDDPKIRKEAAIKLELLIDDRPVHKLLKMIDKGKVPLDEITAQALFSTLETWIKSHESFFEVLDFRKSWSFTDGGLQQISDIIDQTKLNIAIRNLGGKERLNTLNNELIKIFTDIQKALNIIGVNALPIITNKIEQSDKRVEQLAIESLITISQGFVTAIQNNEISYAHIDNETIRQMTISLLKSCNRDRKKTIFKVLSGLGVNTYKVIIDEGLNNKYLREYSAMFLGDMMVREAVKPLIKSLRKGSDLFKMEVACALRKIKDESTVDFLISEAEDPILTPYIAYSLGWRGNKKAVPFLRSLLQRKGAIKTNAASALVEIGESPG